MSKNNSLLSVEEYATKCGVNRQTVYVWIKAGLVTPVRVSAGYAIETSHIIRKRRKAGRKSVKAVIRGEVVKLG